MIFSPSTYITARHCGTDGRTLRFSEVADDELRSTVVTPRSLAMDEALTVVQQDAMYDARCTQGHCMTISAELIDHAWQASLSLLREGAMRWKEVSVQHTEGWNVRSDGCQRWMPSPLVSSSDPSWSRRSDDRSLQRSPSPSVGPSLMEDQRFDVVQERVE